VIGVAGPGDDPGRPAAGSSPRPPCLHSPNDLQIYLLTDSSGKAGLGVGALAAALPPGRRAGLRRADRQRRGVGRHQDRRAARHHRRRSSSASPGRRAGGPVPPDIVVVFDGSRKLRSLPGPSRSCARAPGRRLRHLPGRGRAAAARRVPGRRRRRAGRPRVQQMRWPMPPSGRSAGPVTPGWCARLARSIAPIRDVSDEDDSRRAARLGPAARRARPRAAGRQAIAPAGGPAAGPRWRDRRVLRRAVRHRHAQGRAARADRRHHRVGQVRAAADDRRLARGRQPARRDDVRARRLQGRQRVRRLRPAAAHRRHGHRPRPASGRAGAGLAVGRADPARAHPGRGRRQGHRGLPAAGGHGARRPGRCPGWSSSSTSSRRWCGTCRTSSPAW
jgi:hypothetical protein